MIRNAQRSIGKPQKGVWGVFANQCPISGGSAVFKARAMLYLVMPNLKYDDRAECNRQGINFRKAEPLVDIKNASIKVYPNPTKELLNIEYSIESDCVANLVIYNALGEIQASVKLESDKSKLVFSTVNLAPGVYFYHIMCDTIKLNSGKFAIIRK
nr:T9SS type A sorting domain-containing protein [Bacteroidota bacterium]